MRDWEARRVARAAGAGLLAPPDGEGARSGPAGVAVDSRLCRPGELFVGLRGEREDGGRHAAQALREGAWGALVAGEHAEQAAVAARAAGGAVVLVHRDPLAALHALARAWRRELRAQGARVVALTGSTGKTSTKDIIAALLEKHLRTAATPANLNTEIGLPLAILAAPAGCEALVLEMAMRGAGQIAELTGIAEPDVGLIVNVGPAHLELLGSLEAIAAAKAELITGLQPGAQLVVPAREPLLAPHLRADLVTTTFGEGGDVSLIERRGDGAVLVGHGEEVIELRPSFAQAHNLRNLLAATAAALALGVRPEGPLEVRFSGGRGERIAGAGGVTVIDDCYNANPMSMRAAIDELAETATGRRVAVLGDMLELGPDGPALHREIGAHAADRGVELLVAVGPLARDIGRAFEGELHAVDDARAAAALLPELVREGDTVLVKGSRGVGLEPVVSVLAGDRQRHPDARPPALAPGAGPERR
jgi:UDP-N-acetylmuramoyl-tripeptide--D-alanyl-D-alanine ligase